MRVCSKVSIGDAPISLEFIGRANIWIDNLDERQSILLARDIICKALLSTAPGQINVIGYDSDLSGVFAPFASLSSGESRKLELVPNEDSLTIRLGYLRQQIQATQNEIQGRTESLIDFRRDIGRPVEGYTLVVLSLDMGMIDNDLRNLIALLMKSGPAAGISFLLLSTTLISISTKNGPYLMLKVEDLAPNTSTLLIEGGEISRQGTGERTSYQFLSATELLDRVEDLATRTRAAALPVIRFDELHDLSRCWERSSADGVTFALGKYGVNDVEVTVGDEANQRHNVLITGAVGQGKSNLISVIVHSLCLRYSPRELELYLLDFKEGVTFKAFSNIGHEEWLPHAIALGLDSDVSFGLSILQSLYREYRQRMQVLKDHDVRSVKELRTTYPEVVMARIVVIIDEFQLMFGDDPRVSQEVVDLLEKSVRLFRAVGIHFILSSQTLGGSLVLSQKKDAVFSQVPIRIALKNSLTESHATLANDNPAAAFLRPREAIVNLDYGAVSQNRKTTIAFADEELLRPLRRLWWERWREKGSRPPFVFESERRARIASAATTVRELRAAGALPSAVVGNLISIDGERLVIPLPDEPGRNIAIIGTPDVGCNQAEGMIEAAALSLACQHPRGDARFVICDFARDELYSQRRPEFDCALRRLGFSLECLSPASFADELKALLDDGRTGDSVYVFGLGFDRWHPQMDPYAQNPPLQDFTVRGPADGMHLIGWWSKASSFREQTMGYGSADAFDAKLFLRLDERSVQSLIGPFSHWRPQENRALASDSVTFSGDVTFLPYAPMAEGDAPALLEAARGQ